MNKKLLLIPVVFAGIALGTTSFLGIQEASAHQSILDDDKNLRITIGHDGEPAFGHEPGVWLGKHNAEVILRDTSHPNSDKWSPISGADLMITKYYFADVGVYNAAVLADDITQGSTISDVIEMREVRGEPGTYHAEQIISAGIYGYNVVGTANGEDVDVTLFCRADGMSDTDAIKFEEVDGGTASGEFGCPRNMDDIKFP